MQFESPTQARQSAALRLMQRVDAITKSARLEIFPMPGDPPPGRSVLAERQLLEELEALTLAEKGPLKSDGPHFWQVKHPGGSAKFVNRAPILRLIDKGLMAWGNSVRTFAVTTSQTEVAADPTERKTPRGRRW